MTDQKKVISGKDDKKGFWGRVKIYDAALK